MGVSESEVPASRTVRRVGMVLLVGYVLMGALMAYAATRASPGDPRLLFILLTASFALAALAAATAMAVSRTGDRRWTGVVVALLLASGALLVTAAVREDGFGVLSIAALVLLMDWWLVKALRATHSGRPTTAAAAPPRPSG